MLLMRVTCRTPGPGMRKSGVLLFDAGVYQKSGIPVFSGYGMYNIANIRARLNIHRINRELARPFGSENLSVIEHQVVISP